MRLNKVAVARHAQVVRIVSELPVLVHTKRARIRQKRRKAHKVYLPTVTLVIRYTDSGDVVIETEPP